MAVGSVAASHPARVWVVLGEGTWGGQGLSPGGLLGNAPPSASLVVVLQASVHTCDLPLHIILANLLLKSRCFSVSYLSPGNPGTGLILQSSGLLDSISAQPSPTLPRKQVNKQGESGLETLALDVAAGTRLRGASGTSKARAQVWPPHWELSFSR